MKLTIRPRLCFDDSERESITNAGFSGASLGCWLPSGDVDTQIDFMIRCRGDQDESIAFYRLPSAAHDGTEKRANEQGLLALPLGDSEIPSVPATVRVHDVLAQRPSTSNTRSFATSQCWIASQSRLEPACPPQWLAEALPSEDHAVCAWLPRIGLFVLEPSDRVTLDQCVCPPSPPVTFDKQSDDRCAEWTAPPTPPALPHRLAGLRLLEPLTAEDVLGPSGLGGAGADIGRDAEGLGDQSDTPAGTKDEKSGRRQSSTSGPRNWKSWMLRKLDKLAGPKDPQSKDSQAKDDQKGPPASPLGTHDTSQHGSNARNRRTSGAGSISASLFRYLSRSVAQERENQLEKLLQMSRMDPDRALRFAIPLAGADAFRGLAIPGARLMSRLPNFSLSGLHGGGGPADVWDIDPQVRSRLVAAYHEMANRESAAGRHRRAAYIHANLLGNYAAAAAVLEAGGYFQEAAALYREKLNRPAEAAKCLMAAGLFEQAAEIYAKIQDHVNECDAWRRAGDDARATRALEHAVTKLVSSRQIVDAAEMIDDLLDDRARAIELLFDQWPNGHDVRRCLVKAFTWWGEANEHAIAADRLRTVIETTSDRDRLRLVELTHHLARRYPDRHLQRTAEDRCRVAVSQILVTPTSSGDADRALTMLRTLDSSSPLLGSDATRFASRHRKREHERVKSAQPASRSSSRELDRLRSITLPKGNYITAQMVNDELFVMRHQGTDVWVARLADPGKISGTQENLPFHRINGVSENLNELCPVDLIVSGTQIYVRFPHEQTMMTSLRLESQTLADAWTIHWRWPGGLQSSDVAVAASDDTFANLETNNGETILTQWSNHSMALRTYSLTSLIESVHDINIDEIGFDLASQEFQIRDDTSICPAYSHPTRSTSHLAFLDQSLVVAAGSTLIVDALSSSAFVAAVGHPITAICVSPRSTRRRIAVAHEGGLNVYWWELGELHCQIIETERSFQHVMWMRGGRLFAVSGAQLSRYQIGRQTVVKSGKTTLWSGPTLGLLALSPSVCGVASRTGSIERF
ncbi:cyclic nucleotide-binding protein [Rhodopirellula sp. SWK7]|uniref:cyclic nucleotide-binding protein n=1 Tax=Rhodopirellula sp. SWK7 TaxID=595460 RepID=UPI0002BFB137|nr:cyclic nucleotide-binding protein [Rhodopirellula sp. SWK7]EMI45090.1 cyclic nucleotide-binding protein [Rhodopirellula sp. SWK7]